MKTATYGNTSRTESRHVKILPSNEKRRLRAFIAAVDNNVDVLRENLTATDVNTQDEFGNTALMFAVMMGNFDAVKTLMGLGADPYIVSRNSRNSAYAVAEVLGKWDILEYMLSRSRKGRAENNRVPLPGAGRRELSPIM